MADQAVLPATPSSARAARQFVIDALHAAGADSNVDVAELLVSELVTNAVLHTGSEVIVRVACDAGCVRVEVCDHAAAAPTLRRPTAEATTGRGLVLVEALAAAWGVDEEEAGKVVWFELGDNGPDLW